jgi:NAD(P)H-quinone oxidoreductase subunit 6
MNFSLKRLLYWIVGAAAVLAFTVYMLLNVISRAANESPVPEMGGVSASDVVFYALAAVTIVGAAAVALRRNILHSAIGLLAALLGVGGLYVFLSADFVAITQLLVYIGGVLVLVLFAVMLTNRITEVEVSNQSLGLFGGSLLVIAAAPVLLAVAFFTPWAKRMTVEYGPTTQQIGDAFLTKWLLPFEIASMVLLATLIGAVVIARKEIKAD